MKLQPQLPKAVYPGNVISLLAVITLTDAFLSPLVTDADEHDSPRMGKIFFFAQEMLLIIPVGMVVFMREWKQPAGLHTTYQSSNFLPMSYKNKTLKS